MLATMVKRFMSDWWNWFDVLIVTVSLADLWMIEQTEASITRILRGKSFSSRSATG
jgi:hypothetical protein